MIIWLNFASNWQGKPILDYMEEIKGYIMIVNQKRDMRRIGRLMKVARKVVKLETKEDASFIIRKITKEEMNSWK